MHLPVKRAPGEESGGGCGTSCGAGLEKIYPTTAVRYGAMNWIGEFRYQKGSVFRCGGKVVIQTDRGIELGQQVSLSCNGCDKSVSREQVKRYVENSGPEFYRLKAGRILREATDQDVDENGRLNGGVRDDIDRCALLAAQLDLDMKVVTAEHLLGGERIIFYFRADGRVDFRELVRELAQHYRTRIEMRQVGARDEARLVADYEVCGRECCCKNFLKKLRPVSMKMAKLQKSTLDPSKVSGRCGRLRCCLRYEHEGYEELNRKLPRVGAQVETPAGTGQVIDRQVLTQLLLVRTADQREVTFPIEDVSVANGTARPSRDPADAPGDATESVEKTGKEVEGGAEGEGTRRGGRRRRRRRGSGSRDAGSSGEGQSNGENGDRGSSSGEAGPNAGQAGSDAEQASADGAPKRRRRRRRRGRRSGGSGEGSGDAGSDS